MTQRTLKIIQYHVIAAVVASIVKHIPLSQLTHLFALHQDPDIITSLGLWSNLA